MMKRSYKYIFAKILSVFLFIGLTSFSVEPANAHDPVSSSMEIGFAFYKMANTSPDFQKWMMESEEYKNASFGDKTKLLVKGIDDMRKQFHAFAPEEDQLIVGVDGRAVVLPSAEDSRYPYTLNLLLGDDEVDFFPYEIAGEWIAVVVKDMPKYLTHNLTQANYDQIQHNLGMPLPLTLKKNMKIIFKMKPVSVDAEKPLAMNGHDFWLMMAEPATVSLWRRDSFVWETKASWYNSDTEIELRKLFRE